jgi:adenylate kinase family enzyme
MERGKWSSREQRLYIQFLQENSLEIETKLSRKANKIFKKMSQVIKTRTADQCRSHHQKIINYHETVDRIIRYYSNLFQKDSSRDIGMKMIPTTSNEEG